jgi:CheY-like chemotaxis protein
MNQEMLNHTRPVLVVDKNKGLANLFAAMLSASGYKVIVATDGAEAMARVRADSPCLVLCDQMMPGMSGAELLGVLREDPATAELPFVMMRTAATETSTGIQPNAFVLKCFATLLNLRRQAQFWRKLEREALRRSISAFRAMLFPATRT